MSACLPPVPERFTVWSCIGCGAIGTSQPCLGPCDDRPLDLVRATDARALAALMRRLAWATPREGRWETSLRALRDEALELLGAPG